MRVLYSVVEETWGIDDGSKHYMVRRTHRKGSDPVLQVFEIHFGDEASIELLETDSDLAQAVISVTMGSNGKAEIQPPRKRRGRKPKVQVAE